MAALIRVYDSQGVYLESWGGPGQGPGEFEVLWQLAPYRSDSVIAAESGARRLTIFGPDGGFGRIIRPVVDVVSPSNTRTAMSCCVFWGSTATGDHLVSTPDRIPTTGIDPRWATVLLARLDAEASGIGSSSVLGGGEYRAAPDRPGGSTDFHFGTALKIAPTADGFAAVDGRSYEVRFFGREGALTSIARLARARTALPDEARRRAQSHYSRLMDRAGASAEASGLTWIAERPFPDSLPAYTDLLFDGAGRVWAGYVPGRFEVEGPSFDIFSTSGEFVGTLRLPQGTRPLNVLGDQILVVVTDELGVERVELLRLRNRHGVSA